MKVKTLSLLAGAAAFAATSVASAGTVIDWTVDPGSPLSLVIEHSTDGWLADNGLQSVLISVAGVPEGWATVGILGTGPNPWSIITDSPNGFHNASDPIFHPASSVLSGQDIGIALGNDALAWDSGLFNMGGAFGLHAVLGENAFIGGGGGNEGPGTGFNEDGTGVLISANEAGAPAPGGNIRVLRVTWSAEHSAEGTFSFALASPLSGEGSDQFNFTWSVGGPPVPAPGALALLGLAGLVGTRRRRN